MLDYNQWKYIVGQLRKLSQYQEGREFVPLFVWLIIWKLKQIKKWKKLAVINQNF